MPESTFETVIGTSTDGGQIHMAHGLNRERMSQLCRFGSSTEYLTTIIAALPEESGRAGMLDTLLTNKIKMARLCKNCFPYAVREAYRARIREAVAEQDATQAQEQADASAQPAQEQRPAALDLDHLEFGKAHLISPAGTRYAVIDGDDEGDPRGPFLWLLPVDATGYATGKRRRRLFDTETDGWTIEEDDAQPEPAVAPAEAEPVDAVAPDEVAPEEEAEEEEDAESARLVTDVVLFGTDDDGTAYVLMILRRWEPFADHWALPGGHVNRGEVVSAAAFRELREETGATPAELRFVAFYDDPRRDDRGRYVSFAYTATMPGLPLMTAGDDAQQAVWVKAADVLSGHHGVAFDHRRIISDAALFTGLTA